jgi:hypothetical protein
MVRWSQAISSRSFDNLIYAASSIWNEKEKTSLLAALVTPVIATNQWSDYNHWMEYIGNGMNGMIPSYNEDFQTYSPSTQAAMMQSLQSSILYNVTNDITNALPILLNYSSDVSNNDAVSLSLIWWHNMSIIVDVQRAIEVSLLNDSILSYLSTSINNARNAIIGIVIVLALSTLLLISILVRAYHVLYEATRLQHVSQQQRHNRGTEGAIINSSPTTLVTPLETGPRQFSPTPCSFDW